MSSPHRIFAGLTLFMGLMTVAWSSNALTTLPAVATTGMILGGIAAILGLFALVRRGVTRRTTVASATVPRRRPGLVAGRTAGLFVGLEMLAIPVVVLLLGRFGLGDLIVPAIAFLVAAHFALFRLPQDQPLHVVTAVFGCLGAALAMVLVQTGTLDPAAGRALAGLCLAACTAAYALVFGRLALRLA